jgi:hypothetical protein
MDKDYILGAILIILFGISSLLHLYGKRVPKIIWILSLTSGALAGFLFGLAAAPYPKNIVVGICLIPIGVGIPIIFWLPIRSHRE